MRPNSLYWEIGATETIRCAIVSGRRCDATRGLSVATRLARAARKLRGCARYRRAQALADACFEEAVVECKKPDLQSEFLNALVSNSTPVWVFLINGIKLTGIISSFDVLSLSVQSPSGTQLVNKHAVATIIEQRAPAILPTRISTDRPKRRLFGDQS